MIRVKYWCFRIYDIEVVGKIIKGKKWENVFNIKDLEISNMNINIEDFKRIRGVIIVMSGDILFENVCNLKEFDDWRGGFK